MLNRATFTRYPWRQTGRVIDIQNSQDCDAALKEIGGDFTVEKRQCYFNDGKIACADDYQLVPRTFANVRTDKNSVIGVVGDRYSVLQNKEMVDWFKPWIDSQEVVFHSGGTLHGGAKIWFLAQIDRPDVEVVQGDKLSKFLVFSNSHDGTGSIKVGFLAVRIYCTNMLATLHRHKAANMVRIRHGKGAVQSLQEIRDIINTADADFNESLKEYKLLASKKLKKGDLELYVKTLLGEAETPMADLSTRKLNIMRDIVERCVRGHGQEAENVAGTYWAAYNGFNEYLNYASGNNENNRLASLFNETENTKALRVAVQMANAA